MARYTAESLAQLSDTELDDVIEETVMGRPPPPGLLQRLRRICLRRTMRLIGNGAASGEHAFPAYSSNYGGMGLIMEAMLAKGFTVAVAPGGVVWVAGAGREIKYVGGGSLAMPRTVAIGAVLAVQE
jgi:hypothetical protein